MGKQQVMKPAEEVLQTEPPYELRPADSPVLRGLAFKLFVFVSGTWIFPLLRKLLLGKNGIYKLLRDTAIAEGPTLTPRQLATIPDAQAEPKDADNFTDVQVMTVHQRLATCFALTAGCNSDRRFSSIADYHEAYRSGRVTPTDVAKAIIAAIETNPACRNTFIPQSHDPQDVLQQAAASTARYAAGAPLGPLDGVPYAVKDNIDAGPYPTADGSSWMGAINKRVGDSQMVARLRECGAVLLGKTTMFESGLGTTGLNIRTGTPVNPYSKPKQDRYTGASSSGSGAVVAMGLCPFALGNDGGGSLRIPAAFCGLSTIKVTYGRVAAPSAHGHYSSVTVHGPIATCVRDVALVYSVIANNGVEDQPLPPLMLPKLPQLCAPKPLAGKVVAVYWKWFEAAQPAIVQQCKAMLHKLEGAGATTKAVTIPELEQLMLAHSSTILNEIGSTILPHTRKYGKQMNPDLLLNMRLCGGYTATMYLQAQRIRTRAIIYFKHVLETADFIATPTLPMVAPPINATALRSGETDVGTTTKIMTFMQAANFTGLPAISIPAGLSAEEGLPIGFHLMGRYYQEATLLRAAAILEAQTDGFSGPLRRVPSPLGCPATNGVAK